MDYEDRYVLTRMAPIGMMCYLIAGILTYFGSYLIAIFILLAALSVTGDLVLLAKHGWYDRKNWLRDLDFDAIDRLHDETIALWEILTEGGGHYADRDEGIYDLAFSNSEPIKLNIPLKKISYNLDLLATHHIVEHIYWSNIYDLRRGNQEALRIAKSHRIPIPDAPAPGARLRRSLLTD